MRDDLEFNIEFCQLVEQHPALYDYTNVNYSNRNVQDKLWGGIAKKVGASDKECKDRWKNIRGRYSKYIKSINMPSGSAAKTLKEYYLAPHLHYLANFIKSRTSKGNLGDLENNENSDDDLNFWNDSNSLPPTTSPSTDVVQLPTKSPQYTLKDVNKTAMEYFSTRNKEINIEKNSLDKTDTDLAFLQSMLPDMKSMTQAQKRKFKIGVLNLSEQILSEPLPRPMSYSRTSCRSESPYTRTPSSHEISYHRSSSRESDYNPPTPAPTVQQTQTSRTELPYQSTSSQEINYNPPTPSNQTRPYPAPTVQQTQTSLTELPYQSTSSQEINYNPPTPSNQTRPYPTPTVQQTQTYSQQPKSFTELRHYNTEIQLPFYSPVTPATPQPSHHNTSNESIVDYDNIINNL